MFWHDWSTLASHGQILMTVTVVYHPAVYFRDEEKSKRMINIQDEVEKPFLYIMAWYPSNEQQLLYVEERMKDILNLNEHFDAPAHQLEAGYQKGGNYVCVACPIHCNLIYDLVFIFTPKYVFGRLNQQNSLVNSKLW